MITKLRQSLNVIRTHSQLLLVSILIFIFPAIFLFSFQQFVEISKANVNSVILQKVNIIQDGLETALYSDVDIEKYYSVLSEKQTDLDQLILLKNENKKLSIEKTLNEVSLDEVFLNENIFKTAVLSPGETFVYYPFENTAIVQAYRAVEASNGNSAVYIYTEHNFSNLFEVFQTRMQYAYLSLTAIFLFLIGLAYWLSRQINFEQRYLKAREELQEKDLFMNGLAHEFRAPLTAISGYVGLIQEDKHITSEINDYSEQIKQASSRMVKLISDFLNTASIRSGNLKIIYTKVNVNDLLIKVAKELKPLADIKGLEIKTDLPETIVTLDSDSARLQQILTNIINNSIKYTKVGVINLILKDSHLSITITIADTGGGISSSDQQRLFTPFVRVGDDDSQKVVVGSGLGMWITKQLVEQLGGKISVESIKDVGTHVIIKLEKHQKES